MSLFSPGAACVHVHAAPVKTSAKQAFLEGCLKTLPGYRRTRNSPCTPSPALLSYHPWFGEFITIAAGVTQNMYPERVFDLKCNCIIQKFGVSHHWLFPDCVLLSWTLLAPLSHLPLTVRSRNLKITLWAQFLPWIFSIPIFSSFLVELNKTRGTEAVSESRNIARIELPSWFLWDKHCLTFRATYKDFKTHSTWHSLRPKSIILTLQEPKLSTAAPAGHWGCATFI